MKLVALVLAIVTTGVLLGFASDPSCPPPPAPSPCADSLRGVATDGGTVYLTDSTVTVVWRRVP